MTEERVHPKALGVRMFLKALFKLPPGSRLGIEHAQVNQQCSERRPISFVPYGGGKFIRQFCTHFLLSSHNPFLCHSLFFELQARQIYTQCSVYRLQSIFISFSIHVNSIFVGTHGCGNMQTVMKFFQLHGVRITYAFVDSVTSFISSFPCSSSNSFCVFNMFFFPSLLLILNLFQLEAREIITHL